MTLCLGTNLLIRVYHSAFFLAPPTFQTYPYHHSQRHDSPHACSVCLGGMLSYCHLIYKKVTFLTSHLPSLSHPPAVNPSYFIVLLGYSWMCLSLAIWELHSTGSIIFSLPSLSCNTHGRKTAIIITLYTWIHLPPFYLSWEVTTIAILTLNQQ